MILVAGATGILGGEICRRLAAAGEGVRALVRPTANPDAVARLRAVGAELAEGELRDRASLDAACRGVSAVVSTATTTLSRQPGDDITVTDRDGQLALVEAARAAGVGRFVYVSYSGQLGGDDPLTRWRRRCGASRCRSSRCATPRAACSRRRRRLPNDRAPGARPRPRARGAARRAPPPTRASRWPRRPRAPPRPPRS